MGWPKSQRSINTMNLSWGIEKWRVKTKETVKENAALSGSCGVAPCQGQMNREAANRDSLPRMRATGKIEETNMDLLREYRMNAFAQQLHEQLIDPAWSSQPFLRRLLVWLEAERVVRMERGAEKRFKIAGLTKGAYSLRQFNFAPGRGISRQTLEDIIECRWSAKGVPHQGETIVLTVNQLRSRESQAAEKVSLR